LTNENEIKITTGDSFHTKRANDNHQNRVQQKVTDTEIASTKVK